jgi:hypothetical protein
MRMMVVGFSDEDDGCVGTFLGFFISTHET